MDEMSYQEERRRLRSAPGETPTGSRYFDKDIGGGSTTLEEPGLHTERCELRRRMLEAYDEADNFVDARRSVQTIVNAYDQPEAPGETEASVPTRTSEQGLSYHDGTEALREAQVERVAEALWDEYRVGSMPSYNPMWHELGDERTKKAYRHRARRALSQHVGGEG